MDTAAARLYRERVNAPWWLWGAGFLASASLGVAYAAPFTAAVGWLVASLTMALIGVALVRSAPRLEVTHDSFRAGVAQIPLAHVGTVTPLDAEQSTQLRGTQADPFAWMLLRGWVATAIRLDVDDPDDDTPYWYVSTRHPQALADALTGGSSTTDHTVPPRGHQPDAPR